MALTRKQRERLRMKFGGRCAYCGCVLPEKGWHADHVQAVLRKSERCMKAAEKGIFRLKTTGEVFRPEADCPENIFPSCAPCNLLKTTYLRIPMIPVSDSGDFDRASRAAYFLL